MKHDKKILMVLFAVLLAGTVFFCLRPKEKGTFVEITVDGELYGSYPLDEKKTQIPIERNGHVNIVTIHDGVADMTEADCPDKLCVHQKAISKTNETIVCLPNKVVVQVTGAGESELDSVAK